MNEKPCNRPIKSFGFKRLPGRWTGPAPVVLALGVNQGDRRAALLRAWQALKDQGILPVRASRIFETLPLPGSEGGAYLNACVEVETVLRPYELLHRCQGIERAFGRRRERRWGARTLDVDLIVYGRSRMHTPEITLPHPAWNERDFVLSGLQDLGVCPEPATPAVERAQFDRWMKHAEPCILSSQTWPHPLRLQESYVS